MTYNEAVYYLEHASVFGVQLGLERIRKLLERLGNPQNAYKTIHVTGTNGKGSVTAMIASVLTEAGIRTGRYTSPHLEEYTERIHLDDNDISREAFTEAVGKVSHVVECMAAEGLERPTEFEMITAAAFWYFAKEKVEYAVIEVGLGGLLDSTNVIVPVVSVITNVSMDHMKYCGNTIEEIAVQKAGIIKEGVPVVTTAQQPALSIIAKMAYEKHSRLYAAGYSFDIVNEGSKGKKWGEQVVTVQEKFGYSITASLPLMGQHQRMNSAASIMALLLIARHDKRLTCTALQRGIANVRWPGRFQILKAGEVDVVIDGAHNPAGIDTFCKTYEEVFANRKRVFLFSVLADKDYTQMVQKLFYQDDYVICAPAPTPRTADPKEIAAILPCRADWTESIEDGLNEVFSSVKDNQVVCIIGSLYIQGRVRRYLRTRYGLCQI
ncbi:MAG: bifunctional folylpolyglutamate synthase/dihydrofolate synthase [Megasphaera sp.]|jgi:dihydrofolate synthase/folylpolyglutamate synthase|nr:bifunctional folylpolyglutamate synthase/dihydrofolate synthase [Megasphaera sp.]